MKSYPIDPETDQRIENIFQHHPPFSNQLARYKQLRDEAKAFAYLIISSSPKSREQSLALTHLEEAVFFANAAIARHEKFDLEIQQSPLAKFIGCYGGHDPNELPDESEEAGGDPISINDIPGGRAEPFEPRKNERPTGNVIPA
jgi:hypothetical protein